VSRVTHSVAMTSQLDEQLRGHLLQTRSQEDLCFVLWSPSKGASRQTALLRHFIAPTAGDRALHGNASFTGQYFDRVIAEALKVGCGIAFLHSHLGPGWQGMSHDDVVAEQRLAPSALGATGLPLVGLTLGTGGSWSARFWERVTGRQYERKWCGTVRVVGDDMRVTYMDELAPPPRFREQLTRTVSAWGANKQSLLARLHVGVVGAGSVGAICAEGLARTGFENVTAIDFDKVELVNLDRLLHATVDDVGKLKVDLLRAVLPRHATAEGFDLHPVVAAVYEEAGFRAALDCDALIACVDWPWGRSVLNFIAYAHLIPVVDGGIIVRVNKSGDMRGADWRAHVAAPGRRCLECLGQYSPADVSLEREGFLDDPEYIRGLPKDHHLRRNENVFAFSVNAAGMQLMQLISMVVSPAGIGNPGAQIYHVVPGSLDIERKHGCQPLCPYSGLIGCGDMAGLSVTGQRKA